MSELRTPEGPGIATRTAALSVAGIFATAGMVAGAVWLLYPTTRVEPVPAVNPFPAPTLEIHPVASFAVYARAQRGRLAGGGGRVPIDDAMAKVVARGADAYAPPEAQP